jgi:hypothetical protein
MGITCPGRLNLYWRKLAMIMNSSSLMTGQLTIRLLLFLIEALKAEALVGTIERIVRAEEPCAALAAFTSALRDTLEEAAITQTHGWLRAGENGAISIAWIYGNIYCACDKSTVC